MDVANTAESDRPSRKMPAGAVANEDMTRDSSQRASQGTGRGSWAPPRLQVPAPVRRRVPEPIRSFGRLAARSAPMLEVFDTLKRFARTDVTLTFLGETGAGKDVLAHALHEESARANGPFVVFDCGSVAANLVESELLGHERGAFTGAVSAHRGRLRARGRRHALPRRDRRAAARAAAAAPPRAREPARSGGSAARSSDASTCASSPRRTATCGRDVASGQFREDLFFRLAVAVISRAAAARARSTTCRSSFTACSDDLGRRDLRLADGRVRGAPDAPVAGQRPRAEERARLRARFRRRRDLRAPAGAPASSCDRRPTRSPGSADLPLAGQPLEDRALGDSADAREAHGNKAHAARSLGIAVSTLYEKLKKYGL